MDARQLAPLVVLVLVAGSACSDPSPSNSDASAASVAPTATSSGFQPSPLPTYTDAETGLLYSAEAYPVWDDESRASVVKAAETAMAAYAHPERERHEWFAELEPLLTDQAAPEFAKIDPASITAKQVTGAGVIVEDFSAYMATVEVPTDVDIYEVWLSRADANADWLVYRIRPTSRQES